MSNVEKEVILNQKFDKLKTMSVEAEYWSNILDKDMEEFTNEVLSYINYEYITY